jgi:hypothetical protein
MLAMRIASGRVVGGRIEFEGEIPEGATVTVIARDGDETFEVNVETEELLLRSSEQCRSGRTVEMNDLLGELRTHE